ncbi:MAG: aminotransferase class I/II-fold pyridoxal phosphate-dependent enzyme [Bacteroidota bacterium]
MASTNIAEHLLTAESSVRKAVSSGVAHLSTSDYQLFGRTITLNEEKVLNFSSCSYLGLELSPTLAEGAEQALHRYGTQFSASRAYVSLGLYEELESYLEEMFGSPTIVTATTTLGHLSVLPVLVDSRDAVILDHQVHASVNMASQLLRARGVRVEMIRHNRIDMLEARIKKLQQTHNRIWYIADGVYSMFGDFAPAAALHSLLSEYECLNLYIDDAHGTSWTGAKGAGFAKPWFAEHPRVLVAASLNKSFASAGGAMIFPDEKQKDLVRHLGGTLMFSGPVQPPMLGAAIASAKFHLSDELPPLQQKLNGLIQHFRNQAILKRINLYQPSDSPIFFVPAGIPDVAYGMVKRLLDLGFYTNIAAYPSVPYRQAGIRITLNNHLETEDINRLLDAIAQELPRFQAQFQDEPKAEAVRK